MFLLVLGLFVGLRRYYYHYFFRRFLKPIDHTIEAKILSKFHVEGILNTPVDPFTGSSYILKLFTDPLFYGIILLTIYLFFRFRHKSWEELFSNARLTTVFRILIVVFVLTTVFSTFNYYYNSGFYYDRVAVAVIGLLALRYPSFFPLLTFLAWTYNLQFHLPLQGFPVISTRIIFDLGLLIIAILIIKTKFKVTESIILVSILMLFVGHYVVPGTHKLFAGPYPTSWIESNLGYGVAHMVERGRDYLQPAVNFFFSISAFAKAMIITSQLCLLLTIYRFHWRILNISILLMFHLMLYVLNAQFFWAWIIVDMLILFLFWKQNLPYRIFPILLLGTLFAPIWLKPFTPTWFETKFNQTFRYELTTHSGDRLTWDGEDFEGFRAFSRDNFLTIVDEPIINVAGYGTTRDFHMADSLNRNLVVTPTIIYDAEDKRKFIQFIQQYFNNRSDLNIAKVDVLLLSFKIRNKEALLRGTRLITTIKIPRQGSMEGPGISR